MGPAGIAGAGGVLEAGAREHDDRAAGSPRVVSKSAHLIDAVGGVAFPHGRLEKTASGATVAQILRLRRGRRSRNIKQIGSAHGGAELGDS